MTRFIRLHHFVLGSAFTLISAGISSGCVLELDDLDAGFDDDDGDDSTDSDDNNGDSLECLLGTQPDTVGVERSAWSPDCEVECDVGWGHDGAQLEIAWTTHVNWPEEPRAIGLLADGRPVAAVLNQEGVFIHHFQPDNGAAIGGFPAPDIGALVDHVEIDSNVIYVIHSENDDDGIIVLSATSLDSQHELWRRSFPNGFASAFARGGGKLALALVTDPVLFEHDVVVLDLDGEPLWSQPTVSRPESIAFSPSGARLAVAGETTTRVYAAADGTLLDEFVHGALTIIKPEALAFADEDRLVTVGSGSQDVLSDYRSDGWLAGDSLAGGNPWEQVYNRAISWCPQPADDDSSTGERFDAVARLADGSLMAVGSEGPDIGGSSWVVRLSADGAFLGNDRGLWNGAALDVVAGPDGSAFVLINDITDGGLSGFRLRKYVL